ncbi:metal-dependent hydrolase [Paenibacillus sp. GP183]|uniref:metal-dependent hydrolase n=1 Tax=Paenibacillus sp. GP183 TaxID=1882751 RepID=UPI000896A904|nr:metal-dependent hydrolase [Paenibacillus sp. GP183]SEB53657.1 inner membrane protein [Paenibacillus sp. GP183]
MKGSTHLIIGCAIGMVAAAYYQPFTLKNAVLYMAVSTFSALSADLDGESMITSKLGKITRLLRELVLWTGIFLTAAAVYLYFKLHLFYPEFSSVSVMLFLLGFVTKAGIIRNAMISVFGCCLIYAGWLFNMNWLIGFGLFIAVVPWLKHRGLSHTLWALILWGEIGLGLEHQLQIEGIALVSIVGYLSHLLADTLTPKGVKWFFPIFKKSIKLHL